MNVNLSPGAKAAHQSQSARITQFTQLYFNSCKNQVDRDDIPDNKILVPGVVDTTTNFVEHPELVAQRIRNFINIVGENRVIAGSDCGFGTFAGFGAVDPEIAYAKLDALSEGAKLAL